ncbi:MAG: response regulator, partial [Lentisphaerae bacterium]|nr:response regulator [Lentisphaerota bacterium]
MNKPLNILLVDDEPMVIKSVSRFLQSHNCTTVTCMDGLEALEIASREPFDMIIADFELPALNGMSLIQRLQTTNPRCRMVIASGHPELMDVFSGDTFSNVTFLHKPFDLDKLFLLFPETDYEAR